MNKSDIIATDFSLINFDELLNDHKSVIVKDSLTALRGVDSGLHGDSSVKNSPAQFTGLCELRKLPAPGIEISRLISVSNHELSHYEKAIIELQFLYGLRISEVLNIRHSDINGLGAIHVRGLKGSSDRLVYPVTYRNFWLNFALNSLSFPSSYNRFYFYRLYKKKGLYFLYGNNMNNSVTHVMRYNHIVSLLKTNISIVEIQQFLGHKSINSTIHYVNNILHKKRP